MEVRSPSFDSRRITLEFEWDENKRQEIIEKRKIDILYAALIFEGDVLTRVDDREDYGERRFISMGLVDGECFVVVHTQRQELTRLITAWKGGRNGRAQYEAGIARRHQTDEGER
jgi:uncharacterized DUF497 family protein